MDHYHDDDKPIELVQGHTQVDHLDREHGQQDGDSDSESSEPFVFELYEPRSVSTIIAQQQALQESEAAEAAGIILEGVESLEFDFPESHSQSQLLSETYSQIRVINATPVERLFSPGAQFIYALVIITLLGGLIGLAATIESPVLVLIAGISSPILLPICAWKWVRWLDSAPYYYRLLTSLGEDARNLLEHRLLWKRMN